MIPRDCPALELRALAVHQFGLRGALPRSYTRRRFPTSTDSDSDTSINMSKQRVKHHRPVLYDEHPHEPITMYSYLSCIDSCNRNDQLIDILIQLPMSSAKLFNADRASCFSPYSCLCLFKQSNEFLQLSCRHMHKPLLIKVLLCLPSKKSSVLISNRILWHRLADPSPRYFVNPLSSMQ